MSFRHILVSALALAAPALLGIPSAALAGEQDLSVNARLLLAARNADSAALARELKQGAAPNARNRLGETALLIALKKNELGMANTMLEAGTDINLAALNGVTPLMAAAYAGQVQMVATLLARGANVNAVDRLKKNAMTYAAGEGHAEIVKMLLAQGRRPERHLQQRPDRAHVGRGFRQDRRGQGSARRRGAHGPARQPRPDGPRHGPRGQARRNGEDAGERARRLKDARGSDQVRAAPSDPHPREQPVAVDERVLQRAADMQADQGGDHPACRQMHAAEELLQRDVLSRPTRQRHAEVLHRKAAEFGAEVSGKRVDDEQRVQRNVRQMRAPAPATRASAAAAADDARSATGCAPPSAPGSSCRPTCGG